MKRKNVEIPSEMMEAIQDYVYSLMILERESLMENVEEWTDFQRGQCRGAYDAYEEIHQHLRNLIKHGYKHLTVEDYSDYCVVHEPE